MLELNIKGSLESAIAAANSIGKQMGEIQKKLAAAESDIEQLKSLNSELTKHAIESDIKLAELEKQEPVEWQYLSTFGGWSYFVNEKHKTETIKDGRWPIRKLYAQQKPAEPAQRITEQDAYKIISSFANIDLGGLDYWLDNEGGRTLLATLNEHRESVQEPEDRKALLYLMDRFDNEFYVCEKCGHEESTSVMDSAFYLREYLSSAKPVTANKTEVPNLVREFLCDCIKADGIEIDGSLLAADARKIFDSLPPLKGE